MCNKLSTFKIFTCSVVFNLLLSQSRETQQLHVLPPLLSGGVSSVSVIPGNLLCWAARRYQPK